MRKLIEKIAQSKHKTWDDARRATGKVWPRRAYRADLSTIYDTPDVTVVADASGIWRCAVFWDEDHDERVLDALASIYKNTPHGWRMWMAGERKGNLQIIGDMWPRIWCEDRQGYDDHYSKTFEEIQAAVDKATPGDHWPVTLIACRRELDPAWYAAHFRQEDFGMGCRDNRWQASHAETLMVVDYFSLGEEGWGAAPPPTDWKGTDADVTL